MKKKKLILVNPTLSNPFPGFPPLGLGYVAALTPEDWDIEIIDENFEKVSFKECDLVGLTGFTAMANRAYQVATMFRERGVPVVMGGIHASMMPDEALGFVDAVVVGEAESVWADVIADVEAGRLKKRYQGAHTDLKGLVIPRRDLFHEDYFCDTVQTARGCPNDCDFCSVSQFNGFAYRQRPVDEVLDEIETLKQGFLFIVDDNIVGSGKQGAERAIALARGIRERGLKVFWYGQAALNVADDPEVLQAFQDSGCRLLFLGIEAENPGVLHSMKKRVNLRRKYQDVFKKIHDHHIGIHGSFILGTDEDTKDTVDQRLDYMRESHVDIVQYCTLTPYPGTKLFDRLYEEGRLLYTNFPDDWDRYDLTEILFKPRNLEIKEYENTLRRFGVEMYNRKSALMRFFRSLSDTSDLLTAFWCYVTNRLYRTPSLSDSRPGEKFWYLEPRAFPMGIHMNPEMETHRKQYTEKTRHA